MTRLKMWCARFLYYSVRLFRPRFITVTRNNIHYKLDLQEGIDLSIFLFGTYQAHNFTDPTLSIKPDSTILDIGANIGCMSLEYAKKAPNGKIFAIEPTRNGFKRLTDNLYLNPKLAANITPIEAFISHSNDFVPNDAPSSWPVVAQTQSTQHAVHGGVNQIIVKSVLLSIDEVVEKYHIQKVDLIKIDTEGYEYSILLGSENTLQHFRPILIFEVGHYIMEEKEWTMIEVLHFLKKYNYNVITSKGHKKITDLNYNSITTQLSQNYQQLIL